MTASTSLCRHGFTAFFSIIMPVYNGERYVASSIQSVLAQTFRDFELLVINDGSSDQSGRIIDNYAQRFPGFIRANHQTNQGVMCARLKGLELARGQYIIFLDSDDKLRVDALEIISSTARKFNADLLLYRASADEKYMVSIWQYSLDAGRIYEGDSKKAVYREACSGNGLNSLGTKAVKADLFDRSMSCVEHANVISGEDLLISLPVLHNAHKVAYLDDILYFYRPNPEGVTRGRFSMRLYEAIRTVGLARLDYARMWADMDPELVQITRDTNYLSCQNSVAKAILTGVNWPQTKNWLLNLVDDAYFRDTRMRGVPKGHFIKRLLMFLAAHNLWWTLWLFWFANKVVGRYCKHKR